MMLLPELAEKIVKEVQRFIREEIIVIDTEGQIIAGTSRERVGDFHEGALHAIKSKGKFIISENDIQKLKGVKAGINLPIFFQNEVVGVIGITGNPATVTPFAEIIRKMTELLISENHYAEQFDWHSRALETFVLDWVQGKELDESFTNRAKILSIDLERERTATIIEFDQLRQPLSRDIWSAILQSFSQNKQDIVARSGNERMILLIDCTQPLYAIQTEKQLERFLQYLKNSFGISAYAGVGQKTTWRGLNQSYRQAERALKIAKGKREIIFDEQLTLEMLVEELSPNVKTDYIQRTIGPLLQEPELLETLTELFDQNHSLKNTARELHIHINTLHYRFKKVEEMTNLHPGNIHDLLKIYLAILFLNEKNSRDPHLDEYPKYRH